MPGISAVSSARGTGSGSRWKSAVDAHAVDGDGRGRHRRRAARLQGRRRHATDMPQLQEDPATPGVHRFGDQPPARDLLGVVYARRARATTTPGCDLGRFGDDQAARRRALARSTRPSSRWRH
jgi:hypothetical protein